MAEINEPIDNEIVDGIVIGEMMKTMMSFLGEYDPKFDKLTQDEKQQQIDKLEPIARIQVANIVRHLASKDMAATYGRVHKMSITDKHIEAVIRLRLNDPQMHNLADMTNESVVLVLANPDDYFFDPDIPVADKDQDEMDV